MRRLLDRIPDHAALVVATTLVFTALAAAQIVDLRTGEVRLSVDSSADRILPDGEPAKEFYDEVRRLFGGDETLLVALVTDDVFTTVRLEQVARLTARLQRVDGVHHVLSLSNALNVRGVEDGLEIEPFFSEVPGSAAELAALRREVLENPIYGGNLVSRDGRATALLVYFVDMSNREYVERGINDEILRVAQAEKDDAEVWVTGGPHVRAEATRILLSESFSISMLMLAVLGGVLVFAFRSVRGVLLPLATIAISVCWTLGIVVLMGWELNALTALVPPLLTTLGLSYSVHVLSEYTESARRENVTDRRRLVGSAMQRVALPVALTGLTTAAGFASLGLSPLGAVREFGLLSLLGVICTVVASLTFTPGVLALLPIASSSGSARRGRHFERFAQWAGRFALDQRRAVFACFLAIFVLSLWGATRIRVGTEQISKFREGTAVRVHFEAVNEHLEGSNPLLVVLETDYRDAFKEPGNLEEVASLQAWLEEQPEIGGTTSLVDYIRLINRGFHENDPAHLAIPDSRRLIGQLLMVGGSDELRGFVDSRYRTTVVQARARVINSDEVAALTARIDARLAELPEHIQGRVTGTAVVLNQAVDTIMRGQAASVVGALVIIYGILAAMFVSLRIGLVALIPNVLPIAVYFGALGWWGIRLNPGTSLIAPMVLGIAVDDTIHYFARFIREARRLGDEKRATVAALRSVGRPVTYTTVALCLGFLVLNTSELRTQGEVGSLAAFALGFAWLTDFFLTPALCAGLRIVTLWDFLALDLGRQPQHSIALFQGLRGPQARIVALMANVLEVPRGRRLFTAGEPGRALYIVIEGTLRASVPHSDGSFELATHGRGDVLGEVGLFHEKRSADVDVVADARLLRLSDGSIAQLARRYPRIAAVVFRNLGGIMATRMARSSSQIRSIAGSGTGAPEGVELETRGRALEDAFFRREAEAFREQLLRESASDPSAAEAAESDERESQAIDVALVARLTALGLRADTLAALTLIPLVEVAWADGRMEEGEKRAVLAGARSAGVAADSPSLGLLRTWLDERPAPELMGLWRDYIGVVCAQLSVESRLRLRESIVGRARTVAEAAGGFLGVGTISRAEEAVLLELERAFGI